jgi:ubiquinone/menaquinone biosynthesis C-methylase UbiE
MKKTSRDNMLDLQEKLEHELKDILLKDSSEQSFQQSYDKLHKFFIEQESKKTLYSDDLQWFSKIFVELSNKGNNVLDIGCGNGKLAVAIAQKGNTVVGLDVSKIAIKTAQDRLQKIAPELHVTFKQGDARKLPFDDRTFDYITSQDLVEHISEDDFKLHLSEVYRVLKPEGRYVFWTPSELRGGSSLGLHLKEYTISEIDQIIRNTNFKYCWYDLRFYKLKIKVKINQSFMFPVIVYEKLLKRVVRFMPERLNHLLVPRLLFQLKK